MKSMATPALGVAAANTEAGSARDSDAGTHKTLFLPATAGGGSNLTQYGTAFLTSLQLWERGPLARR
jgi:hypothetical protein